MLNIRKLTKTYGQINATCGVNMTINKGDIYGFIGENGAGKTTIIRMITNLIYPTSGTIDKTNKEMTIGAVIEGPSCYPYLSARDNLIVFYHQLQLKNIKVIDEVLAFVGLENTGKKPFKDFSLGMRQRLGIGIAILNKPDFLVLDEPINGLDPKGIIEIRTIIKKLSKHGTTIFISSHMLSELSKTATRFGIISKGKLVKEFTKGELEDIGKNYYILSTSNTEKTEQLLKNESYSFEKTDDEFRLYGDINVLVLAKTLHDKNIYTLSLTKKVQELESFYLNVIKED
ncbi:MAG: ATP-binding cassette domain-containing protein [Fusobacteriaceae bacterium]